MTLDKAVAGDTAASGSRRSVGAPTRFEEIRIAQIRSVGTAFLRARPVVVAPVAISNGALLAASGAAMDQRIALGAGLGTALALFIVERLLLRRRIVSPRWLATSLALTSIVLAAGCALSGAIASPLVPLLVAPAVVTAAAFGRSATTLASLALSLALAIALAAV